MKKIILPTLLLAVILSSCVSTKKYKKKVAELQSMDSSYQKVHHELDICLNDKEQKSEKVKGLENELAYLKSISNNLLQQLNDLSIITNSQAESIKKSLENINTKDIYIKGLQKEMSRKDSLNMALVLNLKGALKDVNDEVAQSLVAVERTRCIAGVAYLAPMELQTQIDELKTSSKRQKIAIIALAGVGVFFAVKPHGIITCKGWQVVAKAGLVGFVIGLILGLTV